MKKNLFLFSFSLALLNTFAQTPRVCLYEEFTGETCPPCASVNPGLNALLASPTNLPKIVAIKWQVPIPTAPTNTWSLYQTNKPEIDWRYSVYGYGINSAPNGRIDGQNQTVFGAPNDNPGNMNDNIITTAQSYTSAFSVTMNRAWDATYSSVTLTVNIQASANFTAVGALKFRLVMIERKIEFATQPGTNGEKIFEDVAVRSFPSIQAGTAMSGTWTVGQTQTFTINCPLPTYLRDKGEVAFVGFIQDDGNRKVAQAVMADKDPIANDAKAISASIPAYFSCDNSIVPQIDLKNNGSTAITALTITPILDGIAQTPDVYAVTLPVGTSTTLVLSSITSSVGGGHNCVLNISGVSGIDANITNNKATTSFYFASNYQGSPLSEGFVSTAFPPVKWGVENVNAGASWSRNNSVGGFGLTTNSTKYDFFNNSAVGDADDLYLPPMDLSGANSPTLTFDVAYAQYSGTSNDQLEVFVSDDCGVNWVNVYSKAGSVLKTSPPVSPSPFLPSSTQWRTDSIDIGAQYAIPSVLVKFKATSAYGNNLYLDNVNLSQSNPVGIASFKNNEVSVSIFPNPSNGETTVNINAKTSSDATISLVNLLGQTVYSKQASLNAGATAVQLDVAELAPSVYNVVISTLNGTTVKKLTVTK
jgi:hypothetical protein